MTCGGASCACSRMRRTRKKLRPCVVAKGVGRAVRCASKIRIKTALNALESLTFAIVHQRNLFFHWSALHFLTTAYTKGFGLAPSEMRLRSPKEGRQRAVH